MRTTLLVAAIAILSWCPSQAQQITVSVCNLAALAEPVVRKAEAGAAALFHRSGIMIHWTSCEHSAGQHTFIIRLMTDKLPRAARAFSLDAMGHAFLAKNGSGYLADVYVRTAQDAGTRFGADNPVTIGGVIAHEIGHLLLGPGHSRYGIMRSDWKGREF